MTDPQDVPRFMTPSAREAIIICTRNRPSHLQKTLRSVAEADQSVPRILLVIDASDSAQRETNREAVREMGNAQWSHVRYTDQPSLARQRNFAVEKLAPSVEIVHFIDDDVTVDPAYFDTLSGVFSAEPDLGGVGGAIIDPENEKVTRARQVAQRLFLLTHPEPGRVLPSGCTSNAQYPPTDDESGLRATQWLSGCSSSYRRSILNRNKFDERLTGYSMLEDLDLSYRVSRESRLAVQPEAQLVHRRAPLNRPDVEQYAYALTVHRRWFVEKHFGSPASRAAYWWSVLGRLLAISVSSRSHSDVARTGLFRGVKSVLSRRDPLLQ